MIEYKNKNKKKNNKIKSVKKKKERIQGGWVTTKRE